MAKSNKLDISCYPGIKLGNLTVSSFTLETESKGNIYARQNGKTHQDLLELNSIFLIGYLKSLHNDGHKIWKSRVSYDGENLQEKDVFHIGFEYNDVDKSGWKINFSFEIIEDYCDLSCDSWRLTNFAEILEKAPVPLYEIDADEDYSWLGFMLFDRKNIKNEGQETV
jgi:hypothetical protein